MLEFFRKLLFATQPLTMNYLTIFLYWKLYALGMVSFTTSDKKNTKEKYLGGRCTDVHLQCDLSIRSSFSRGVNACQHNY